MLKTINGLRPKMLIALAIGMLLLLSLIIFVARASLLYGYAKLENEKAIIQLDGALNALSEQAYQLDFSARDNSHWDDMYQYVENPDPSFIESSFNDDFHGNLKVNAIFIINNQGEILHKSSIDYTTGEPWPTPDRLTQAVSKGGVLVNPEKASTSGLFWTPQGILIISAYDILDSNNQGPRRGTFVLVRMLDAALLQRVEKVLNTKISVQAISDDEILAISPMLKTGKAVKTLDDTRVAGYALINSIGSEKKLVLSTIGDRKIFKLAESSLQFLYWSSALAALLIMAFSWFIDKIVLKKIALLNENVTSIGQSATSTGRVKELGGNDELASLAHGINGMLLRLDESQLALSIEKERALVTLAGIADAVITTNPNGDVTYMNAAAERLTGVSNSEANLKPLAALFHLMSEDELTLIDCAWLTDATSVIDEVKYERADGQKFLLTKSTSAIYDEKMVKYGTVTVIHDVTMLRKLSRQVSYQAKHDQLTGLVNRYEFERKLQEAIDETVTDDRMYCLAYFDLDRFKIVNDTCGHNAGDLLLQQLSNLIKSKVRSSDVLARLGGDEFALLLNGCDIDKAYQVIEGLRDAVQDYRFTYEDKLFKIGASFGLTKISIHQTLTISELFGTVDSACYEAKSKGGNRIQIHSHDDVRLSQRLSQQSWVADIQSALENNQFVLFSQQIKDLTDNREDHLELLIRMRSNDGKLHPPGSFLPTAERYHLMPQLDRWVIHEALRIIASKGADFTSICAINLSGQSLSDDTLLKYIVKQIKHHDVNPKRICFEITETAVIANIDQARLLINELRILGCRFSLDDFGSGLSSFAYLKNLQVDYLKIDGMFVKNIVNNKIDRAMVESINNIGHVMGLQTIGEFAENQAIIDVLKGIGVDYAQGYGVAMPTLFE